MTQSDSASTPKSQSPEERQHPKDPLHGLSLKTIVTELEENYGWDKLAELIPINCFKSDPSIKSSLTFLRKTPWARTKVEELYIKSKANWGRYKKS
ncbi:MAG: hypothetical protein ISEC1_P1022 [Thiomicrorhabdus sp.]|nr:MAG: hypothetical protein ISEC1_P1022 [Thiomicrorhabdus sp.]